MRNPSAVLWIAVLLAATVAVTLVYPELPSAEAADPPLDTGTIYYYMGGSGLFAMNPDGTNKTALSASVDYWCEPSLLPHGGRWFLQVDEVSGQYYPDGRPRLELFAISETGTVRKQLTDGKIDASTFIEPNNHLTSTEEGQWADARWTSRDTKVSYVALRTTYDAQGNRSVQDGGIYALEVDPDDLSNHSATAMSGDPLFSMALVTTSTYTCLWNPHYAWKPDGSAVVFWVPNGQPMARGLWRAEASNGYANPTLLTESSASDFRWSPDGTRILFNGGLGTGIKVIDADGTDETLLLADPSDGKFDQTFLRDIDWSPSGTHIVYGFYYHNYKTGESTGDVDRADSTGSGATDLTSDTGSWCGYPKWRANGSPPTVTVTQPTDGSDVWGTITIKATATDDGTVDGVEFFVDGTSLGTDTTYPYEINWNSATVLDGEHTISAVATDDNDETGSDSVVVTVDNVDDPPTVTITEPEDGDTVSGSSVTIAAVASDDGSIAKVEFFVGTTLVGTDYTSPYSVAWDSTGVADGSHTISAKATDDAGKTGTDSITVTVNNAPPSLAVTSISPNNVRAGKSVNVTVTGTGFVAGASLTLANGSGPAVTVSNVSVASSTSITATIAAERVVEKGAWTWDVVVMNPGGASATLVDGFTVTK